MFSQPAARHEIFYYKVRNVKKFFPQIMARIYDPSGHQRLITGNFGISEIAKIPGVTPTFPIYSPDRLSPSWTVKNGF